MATQKPISTISYNSEAFLREKLDTWVKSHIIQAYQYICHKGEDGDKDHIHLRIEPNKKLDPMDLLENLREFKSGQDKPLGCRPFRPSKEEDWFLYVVHDEHYLKLKYGGGEKGEKLPYKWQDIIVSEYYDLEIAFIRAKAYLNHSTVNLATQLKAGTNPMDLIMTGENVYVVNALMRAMSVNDYQRLQEENIDLKAECSILKRQIKELTELLSDNGLVVCVDDDGTMILTPSGFEIEKEDSGAQ